MPIAHVDLVSLGVLEAPGDYGCALAIGEGQSAGNAMSYGGPHYGFLAARSEYIRRLPGRIVGETVDAAGERGYVLTLQTREQHIRREKATSNITTNQTLLALAGLVHLSLLGPQGLRELGETCMALAALREGALAGGGARARVSRTGNVQGVCGAHRTERTRGARPPRARRASTPATRSGATTPASTTRCSSRSPRSGRSRRSTGSSRRCRSHEADLREVAGRAAAGIGVPKPDLPVPEVPAELAAQAPAAPAGARRAGGAPSLHRALDPQLRHRHRLLSARQLHDEVQPAHQRAARRAARASRTSIRSSRTTPRRARSSSSGTCSRSCAR